MGVVELLLISGSSFLAFLFAVIQFVVPFLNTLAPLFRGS